MGLNRQASNVGQGGIRKCCVTANRWVFEKLSHFQPSATKSHVREALLALLSHPTHAPRALNQKALFDSSTPTPKALGGTYAAFGVPKGIEVRLSLYWASRSPEWAVKGSFGGGTTDHPFPHWKWWYKPTLLMGGRSEVSLLKVEKTGKSSNWGDCQHTSTFCWLLPTSIVKEPESPQALV